MLRLLCTVVVLFCGIHTSNGFSSYSLKHCKRRQTADRAVLAGRIDEVPASMSTSTTTPRRNELLDFFRASAVATGVTFAVMSGHLGMARAEGQASVSATVVVATTESGAGADAGAVAATASAVAVAPSTEASTAPVAAVPAEAAKSKILTNYGDIRLPYDHVNYPLKNFLGSKATIVVNMKIDDPQHGLQFPVLLEIFNRYKDIGLNVLAFPTEQGWFEPDDDETIRAKCKEYYAFGEPPRAVVFDKVDVLGPSANPLYVALTRDLATPNGYGRITMNYEKFLLDATGQPVRRYPRKFSAYDMEADIKAVVEGKEVPPESPAFQKAWREAKREATKSEYSFRYNYNYYTAPDSMYKYKPQQDAVE